MRKRPLAAIAGAFLTAAALLCAQPTRALAQDMAATAGASSTSLPADLQAILPAVYQPPLLPPPIPDAPVPIPALTPPPVVLFEGMRLPATALALARTTRVDAARMQQLPISSQKFHDNILNRQLALYRPNNSVLQMPRDGLTVVFPNPVNALGFAGNSDPYAFFTAKADARADAILDTTKVPGGMFLPSAIPVSGEAFARSGERMTITSSNLGTIVKLDTVAGTGPTSGRLYTEFDYFAFADGDTRFRLRFVWGSFANFVVGMAPSMFSDPDAVPDTIDPTGPNAQLILSHALIGYIIPFSTSPERSFYAGISMEAPEADANPGFTDPRPGPYDSYSHIPDFAAKVRWEDKAGHLQGGAVIRDIALENAGNTFHRDAVGWGVRFSGALIPFARVCGFQHDTMFFAVAYGEGIAAYILDLHGQGDDAVVDAADHLKALPVLAYYAGYTHYWTRCLRSSAVYSEVDLDNIAVASDPKELAYHRGRYVAVNTVYQWRIQFGDDPDPKKNLHTGFAGLEYLYGLKETVGRARGEDNRVQFTLGLKY